jgi:hypothetical protein
MSDRSEEEYLDELLKSMSFDISDEDEEEISEEASEEIDEAEDIIEENLPESSDEEFEMEVPEYESEAVEPMEIEEPIEMEEPMEIEEPIEIEEPTVEMPDFDFDMSGDTEDAFDEEIQGDATEVSDFDFGNDDNTIDIEDDIDSKLLNSLLINESDDDDAEALEIDDLLKALQEEETAATIEEPVPEPTIEEGDDEEIILDDDFLLNDLDGDIDPSSLFADDFSDLLAFSEETFHKQEELEELDDKKTKKKKSDKDDKGKKSKLKKFLMAFDDGDDEPVNKKDDSNKALMNEAFGEEEQDKKDPKAEKKAKAEEKKAEKAKEKERKKLEKQKKAELKQAEKMKNMDLESQVVISFGRIIRVVAIVAVVCVVVILGSKWLSYAGNINSAKKLFNSGSYTAAFERINGLEIKDRDEHFYMQTRIMASLYQGIESYDNYIKIGNETMAISSLVKTVARRYDMQEDITKYEVTSQAEAVYKRILNILDGYGITENEALSLNSITNYEEFINKISSYGGNE